MTDVIRPANGQAANAQSSGNAWQDPHGSAGYDGAIRERTLIAPQSGEARAWPKRPGPGAESPAGWFLPTDGEAAPPFRFGLEPARSDNASRPPGADRADRGGRRQHPQPAPVYPARDLWPWTFPTGSRPVPVVGPTEALRGRAVSTGIAAPMMVATTTRARSEGVRVRILDRKFTFSPVTAYAERIPRRGRCAAAGGRHRLPACGAGIR